MKLTDLSQLAASIQNRYRENFNPQDSVLPESFKSYFRKFNNNDNIEYYEYSLVVRASSSLDIFIPNQWIYIAYYFVGYYNMLKAYRDKVLSLMSKDDAKSCANNEDKALSLLATYKGDDKDFLIKFLSDYSWWGGGKTIDRNDYYVSPILSIAGLVNASQSYVADICKNLAESDMAYQILDSNVSNKNIYSRQNVGINNSLQIIYYGAPGTGKSHKIKDQLDGISKENIFRTTFHPDSDYASFVGAYKPKTEKKTDKVYTKNELISKLTEMKEGGVTYSPQKFGAKYWRSLKKLNLTEKKDILQACGMSDNYTVEFDKGVAVGEEYLAYNNESRIIYSFVPQTFLNAYIRAYQTDDNVYLIIEEINRGNCAQIFGDLFQLLDRDKNGISAYSIKADADLRAFLEEQLGEDSHGIKDGELCLPSNLYIYATMNTSDQSLFPIDSAFKRRWDWEYEPIKYKNTDWKIVIDGIEYSWVSFQRKVNDKILNATSSEDKMLGDYFVNPSDGIITDKVLLNKILFYLWNDVCKDGEGDIFKISETENISFSELYGKNGPMMLIKMMSYLGVTAPDGNKVSIKTDDEIIENQSE